MTSQPDANTRPTPQLADPMSGSCSVCATCGGSNFLRDPSLRTVYCATCSRVAEEYRAGDLFEFSTVTNVEQVHCVVTPDMASPENCQAVQDPEDDFETPGFISAFRMLSPFHDPVYATSSRTMSGDLAEMERILGSSIYSGYVGYNGRTPGARTNDATYLTPVPGPNVKNEPVVTGASAGIESQDAVLIADPSLGAPPKPLKPAQKASSIVKQGSSTVGTSRGGTSVKADVLAERVPSETDIVGTCEANSPEQDSTFLNCDARHAIVAYFEVVDLADMLDVDHITTLTAVQIFRVTAAGVPVRNRSVEALAAACLCAAVRHRVQEHDKYLVQYRSSVVKAGRVTESLPQASAQFAPASVPPRPRTLSAEVVCEVTKLDLVEVQRFLQAVSVSIGVAPVETASVGLHRIPDYAKKLDICEATTKLVCTIVSNVTKWDICPRRNAQSICAGALHVACQFAEKRKTQAEICNVTGVTEVTLRKVVKELLAVPDKVLPDGLRIRPSTPSLRADRSRSIEHKNHTPNSLRRSEELRMGCNVSPDNVQNGMEGTFDESVPGDGVEGEDGQQKLFALMQNPALVHAVEGAMAKFGRSVSPPPLPPPLPPVLPTATRVPIARPCSMSPANVSRSGADGGGSENAHNRASDSGSRTTADPHAVAQQVRDTMNAFRDALSAAQAIQDGSHESAAVLQPLLSDIAELVQGAGLKAEKPPGALPPRPPPLP